MMHAVEQLEAEMLDLPAADRARLAERLIASLDEDADVEQAWADEVERRAATVAAGQADVVPAEEMLASIRSHIGQ